MSVVEQKLREDPGGVYGRDGFRHARPLPARGRGDRESAAGCRKARSRARRSSSRTRAPARPHGEQRRRRRAAHVGFYLIDKGRPQLERAAEVRRFRVGSVVRRIGQPVSAAALSRRDRADHGGSYRGAGRQGARPTACPAGMLALARRRWLRAVREPARGRAGQLARDAARDAAPAAADGLFARASRRSARTLVVVPDDARRASRTSTTWSRRSKCASSPIATSICISAC